LSIGPRETIAMQTTSTDHLLSFQFFLVKCSAENAHFSGYFHGCCMGAWS
jgi:hypothetical protein